MKRQNNGREKIEGHVKYIEGNQKTKRKDFWKARDGSLFLARKTEREIEIQACLDFAQSFGGNLFLFFCFLFCKIFNLLIYFFSFGCIEYNCN